MIGLASQTRPSDAVERQAMTGAGNGMYWLAGEFENSLAKVRRAIEQYLDDRADGAPLDQCVVELHQLRGIGSVVQCFGAVWLAEEMKRVCQALLKGSVHDADAALTALLGATVQLGDYLELLSDGQRDALLVFHPTINELRLARGAKVLSETQVFARHMAEFGSAAVPDVSGRDAKKARFTGRKLYGALHTSLVAWTRGEERTENLKRIGKVTEHLAAQVERPGVAVVCQSMAATVEALLGLMLPDSMDVKRLLGQGCLAIKGYLQSPQVAGATSAGESAEGQSARDEKVAFAVAYQLQYLVHSAGANGRRARALRETFYLDQLLSTPAELEELRHQMRGPNITVLNRVAAEVCDELSRAKDDIDLVVRTGTHEPARFEATLGMLKRVSDTLSMLGLGPLERLIEQQIETLEVLPNEPPDDPRWIDVASALLLVEHTLEESLFGQLGGRTRTGIAKNDQAEVDLLRLPPPPRSDLQEGTLAALREALVNLAQVKQYLASFLESGDRAVIEAARRMLHQIQSVLAVIGADRAAELVARLHEFAGREIFAQARDHQALADQFADPVAGVEYVLEAMHQQLPKHEHYLDALEASLDRLDQTAAQLVADGGHGQQAEDDSPDAVAAADENATASPPTEDSVAAQEAEGAAGAESAPDADRTAEDATVEEIDAEFKAIFVEEAQEVLETLNGAVPQLQQAGTTAGDDAVAVVRRSFHTLKGSGRMVGADSLAELAWVMEQLLNRCIDGGLELSSAIKDCVVGVLPVLSEATEAYASDDPNAQADQDLTQKINKAMARGNQLLHGPQSGERAHNVTFLDPELYRVFREDAQQRLQHWRAGLTDDGLNKGVDRDMIRALHTLTGSASALSMDDVSELTGQLEKLCESVASRNAKLTDEQQTLLRESADAVEAHLVTPDDDTGLQRLIAQANTLLEANLAPAENAGTEQLTEFANAAADQVDAVEEMATRWRDDEEPQALAACAALSQLATLSAELRFGEIEDAATSLRDRIEAHAAHVAVPPAAWFDALFARTENLYQLIDSRQAGHGALVLQIDDLPHPDECAGSEVQDDAPAATDADVGEPADAAGSSEVADLTAVAGQDDPNSLRTESLEPQESQPVSPELPGSPGSPDVPGATPSASGDALAQAELAVFSEDAENALERIDQQLAALELRPDSNELAQDLRRELHTLKGAARSSGAMMIGEIANRLESIVACVLQQRRPATSAELQHVHTATDGLHRLLGSTDGMIHSLAEAGAGSAGRVICDDLDQVLKAQIECSAGAGLTALHARVAQDTLPAQDVLDALQAWASRLERVAQSDPDTEAAPVLGEAIDVEVAEIFLGEAGELLEQISEATEALQASSKPAIVTDEIRRALHTLKGGARMAGLAQLGDATHVLETDLERVVDDASAVRTLLQERYDELAALVDSAERALSQRDGVLPVREPIPGPVHEPVHAPASEPGAASVSQPSQSFADDRAESLATSHAVSETSVTVGDDSSVAEPEDAAVASDAPQRNVSATAQTDLPDVASEADGGWSQRLFWTPDQSAALLARRETARVTVEQLDAMMNQAGEVGIAHSQLEQQMNSMRAQLGEFSATIDRIGFQLRALDRETDAQIQARQAGRASADDDRYAEQYDPLEMDRYTRMQELSRSLAESANDLSNLHSSFELLLGESDATLQGHGRTQTTLQQGLMGTLMVPFSRQVQRLRRLVRQAADEHGRQVDMTFSGVESELDRNVLERMTAPLEHLLRNAVVHGIEFPVEREQAGKRGTGMISVALKREGTQLVIEVADDGGGLDLPAIRSKAVDKGLMQASDVMSDEAIARWIFAPGFSTAQSITQSAGRGVGMDVVAAEVNALGGTVDVRSERGKGVTFVVRLPLSLAISQALLLKVADETFAVPIGSIEAIAKLPAAEAANKLQDNGEFEYGGEQFAVRHFGGLVGLPTAISDEKDEASVTVVLARYAEGLSGESRRVALIVNALIGSREIVSKPVGAQVGAIAGIAGATIMPDGEVVFILDLASLLQDRHAGHTQVVADRAATQQAAQRQAQVLVVDDSVTMRRVAERMLTRAGYGVDLARDGLDALAQLQTRRPDIVLLDIEMPRVDGFEVAAFIRNTDALADVPIIMITSRSGDKHRKRAAELGVNQYMIKPYQEANLLHEVAQLLPEHVTVARAAGQERSNG